MQGCIDNTDINIPTPEYICGHRWGGAFPNFPEGVKEELAGMCNRQGDVDGYAYVDENMKFAVCGDYFVEGVEGVEAAILSSASMVNKIFSTEES